MLAPDYRLVLIVLNDLQRPVFPNHSEFHPGRVTFTASRPNTHPATLLRFFSAQLMNLDVFLSTNTVAVTGLEISSWKDASPRPNLNRSVSPKYHQPEASHSPSAVV